MSGHADNSSGNSWVNLLRFYVISFNYFMNLPSSSQTRDTIDSVLLWKSIFFGFWSLALTFFTCEVGHQFTHALSKVNKEFGKLDWYLFPVQIQRLLPTVTNYIQQPVVIECFGVIDGSRDQFKKVTQRIQSIEYHPIEVKQMNL